MPTAEAVFQQHIGAILGRYCRQNGLSEPNSADRARIEGRLWEMIRTVGLPQPLAAGEVGSPGELSAAEVGPKVERVLEGIESRVALLDPVRQLVKACFHREFTVCRDSYREVSSDGTCRRQQLKKARGRVSGSHCVDCPYWTVLSASEHADLLAKEWVSDVVEFNANRDVYLPEDFRALRKWLHAAARLDRDAEKLWREGDPGNRG